MIAGRNLFGVLVIVAAGFSVLLGVLLRHWVPLAASMIRLATDILQRNPMLVDVALATLALQLVWCAVWCTAASGLMRQENPPLCGRDHMAFRSAYFPVKNVVDGDLCEQYPQITMDKQQGIAEELDRTPGEVLKKLEEVRNRVI